MTLQKGCPLNLELLATAHLSNTQRNVLQKPILTIWQPHHPTCLEVDVSDYATGGVLLQKLNDDL